MGMFTLRSVVASARILFGQKRCFHQEADSIVIASAVRTPWGKYQGQLAAVGASQLAQITVEAAVKQSAIPFEQVQRIYMAENHSLHKMKENDFILSSLLKKSKYIPVTAGSELNMDSLLKAIQSIKSQGQSIVVVGGSESATHEVTSLVRSVEESEKMNNDIFSEISSDVVENYISKSMIRFLKSQLDGVFDAELVPLKVQQLSGKRKVIREVTQDEAIPENYQENYNALNCCDGAAAFILTTSAKAQELDLSPLAVLTDFECIDNSTNILASSRKCIENLLAKTHLDLHSIKHWEIDDSIPQLVVFLKYHFDLNFDLINPHAGSLIMGHSASASLSRTITHLTHYLEPHHYGCLISTNNRQTLGLLIKKLPSFSSPNRLPLVTLYTKDSCALCDILVEELEMNFAGEYELEKVFIDNKENIRFLRLFRHDIPVVFLNNQFLCMHRLNHRLLRRKLDLLKQQ